MVAWVQEAGFSNSAKKPEFDIDVEFLKDREELNHFLFNSFIK